MKLIKYINATLATIILLTTSASITPAQQPNSIKQQVKSAVVAPQKITDAALRNARTNWGLGKNSGKIIYNPASINHTSGTSKNKAT
jgi:hypothetical protein